MSASDLDYLFIQQKEIFNQTSPETIIKLARMYKNDNTKEFLKDCAHYHLEHHILA